MGECYSAEKNLKSASKPGVRLKATACFKERQSNPTLLKKEKKLYIYLYRENQVGHRKPHEIWE